MWDGGKYVVVWVVKSKPPTVYIGRFRYRVPVEKMPIGRNKSQDMEFHAKKTTSHTSFVVEVTKQVEEDHSIKSTARELGTIEN